MVLLALPPTLDSPPKFCSCGRKTVASHEFFCSSECARNDSLRSLGDPNCHYREIVREAYVQAGAPGLQPRRAASTVNLRPGPTAHRVVLNEPPPFNPQTAIPLSQADRLRIAPWEKYEPILPVPLDNVPRRNVTTVARRHGPSDHSFGHVPPDAGPSREQAGTRSLRRAASSTQGLQGTKKQSPVASLLNFGRSQKSKEENTGRAFGQPLNVDVPSARKERRMGRAF